MHKQLFDKVRGGDVDDVVRMVREFNIDVSSVVDEAKNFHQHLVFTACVIKDVETSLKMIKVLIELGVDPKKEDSLKQTPIFYASREGLNEVISFLVEKGIEVNRQDKYGQTPIYYAVREGHIKTVQQLLGLGADSDIVDSKNQRPIYYAIQANRYDMCQYLIQKGANMQMEDKKGMTPTHWAKKQNKPDILQLLLDNGGVPIEDGRRPNTVRKSKSTVSQPEPKPRENERKIPRRYMLTLLREGGFYSPMTDAEFEDFRRQNPQIAKYFEANEEEEEKQPKLDDLEIPEVPESAPIYDQWEKAAQRMLTGLLKDQRSYIFTNPVDPIALNIPDYDNIVKNPMCLSFIKQKLKENKYERIQDFMSDMELVFYNCRLYNGTESSVGRIGVEVE